MANNKKRAGEYNKSVVKTSDFLPSVFQTNINKRWLDSTLDQMVSKSDLKQIDGFIGNRSGKYADSSDVYIEPAQHVKQRARAQFSPAVLSKNPDGSVDNILTFDDMSNVISNNFDTYNYNSAYASDIYGYYPPFDVDKFLNYTNYYWVKELPVYDSINTTSATVLNPVATSLGDLRLRITDDNNTFDVEDNMLIKFVGGQWDPAIQDRTYIVVGVGSGIKLLEYKDNNGMIKYPLSTKSDTKAAGFWDKSPYLTLTPNTENSYWDSNIKNPHDMIAAYNSDVNRLPLFDGFNFTDIGSNPKQFTRDILVKFDGDEWDIDEVEKFKIYYTEVDSETGNVSLKLIIDAVDNGNGVNTQILVDETDPINELFDGWDTDYYDSAVNDLFVKDYLLIVKHDEFNTAWSRSNHWVNINTIKKVYELKNNSFSLKSYINTKRVAQRPIIEMTSNMSLWDFADTLPEFSTIGSTWLGAVDFVINLDEDYDINLLNEGNTVVFYREAGLPGELTGIHEYANGAFTQIQQYIGSNTLFVTNALQDSMIAWNDADVYVDADGTGYINLRLGQQKVKVNQAPLYKLFTQDGTRLEDIPGSRFKGSKIFGYKIGTGNPDHVMGFPLSYKDSPKGAEYQFENFILTETYKQSYNSSIDYRNTHYKTIPGYYFFKRVNKLGHVYSKSEVLAGTNETHVYDVTDNNDLVIPFGTDDWRPNRELLIYQVDGDAALTEIVSNGVYLNKKQLVKNVAVVGVDQTIVIHNLIQESDLQFTTLEGYDLENPPVGVDMPATIDRNGPTISIIINADADGQVINVAATGTLENYPLADTRIAIDKYQDSYYHNVYVNGKFLSSKNYTITNNTITIGADLISKGDLVDFRYYAAYPLASAENTSRPQTWDHNATNETLEIFTQGETRNHWQSIISSQPGFDGDTYGYNNYAQLIKQRHVGGTIFTHADVSIMHDISYANKTLDISGALIEQGADWDIFLNRFKSQVRRLYATKTYTSVFDLTTDAITSVLTNRKGNKLYKNSNMVFAHKHNSEKLVIKNNNKEFYSKYVFNGDDNIRDHAYVYLSDDRDGNGIFIQRLLTKDVEYNIVGNKIVLLIDTNPSAVDNSLPYLTLYYHQMDEDSYVPPSPVKLKIVSPHVPAVINNDMFTHDGRRVELNAQADLANTRSPNFDPVNAAWFDLEKRIYAGLVNPDKMYGDERTVTNYSTAFDWLPSQHRGTWYTLATVNNFIERHYYRWARERDITGFNPEGYYNPLDPWTWNYSSILIGEHFSGNTLPGHWTGAYNILFGTCTPHLTPWHMLGHSFKPTWWDEYYSWTDPVKRAALINSLQYGVVGRPRTELLEIVQQRIEHARYYWDWNNLCPVDTDGNLVSPDVILGAPSEINRSKEFVFGDFGPVEQEWRVSSQGQCALIDAIIKLNPNRAWTAFFQPGTVSHSNVGANIYTGKVPTPQDYLVPGKVYNSVIDSVIFENTFDKISENADVFIADGDNTINANLVLSFDPSFAYQDGDGVNYQTVTAASVVGRGMGFVKEPAVITNFSESVNDNTKVDITMKKVECVACGLSQAQHNYILRNHYDTDLEQVYGTLGTQLAQKVGGFTSKHLLNVSVESSYQGAFRLSEGDYSLKMYSGYPTDIPTASQVIITKTELGYVVDGISSQEQEFYFYEPDLTNASGSTTVAIGNTSIRKYKRFAGSPSIIEFGSRLARIQDTYDFIRGYWHWMELAGYTLGYNGEAQATAFAKWAITADDEEQLVLEIGKEIKFTPDHGSVFEYNQYRYHKNDILDENGDLIETSDLSIDRLGGTVTIKTKDDREIGSVASAILDHEHIAIFNNVTGYNVTLFNPVNNLRYNRLYVSGQTTDNWTGEKKAQGYLVFDDHITQNFDSSVSAVDDFYKTDVAEFNPAVTKAKDLTIGNIDREWISNLGLSKNTVTQFYQGVIKEKGTNNVIDKIARTSILDHGSMTISANEQYMFNQGYLGENKVDRAIEIELKQSQINSNPQIIKFNELLPSESSENILVYADGDPRTIWKEQENIISSEDLEVGESYYIVEVGSTDFIGIGAANNNIGTAFTATAQGSGTGKVKKTDFEIIPFEKSSLNLLTAGEPLASESRYYISSMDQISDVFEENADYAVISTWLETVSYKLGDLVRYKGGLWKCMVNSTGLAIVSEGISVTGSTTSPAFPYGTVANIAGTTTTLERTSTVFEDIIATGSVIGPTMLPSETLVIDGVSISFEKSTTAIVVTGPAKLTGSVISPTLPDVTGHSITINGEVVDFDITPAPVTESFVGVDNGVTPLDVVENITGVLDQQDYVITSETLTPNTWSIASITVDGIETTDWAVTGQTVTFTDPLFLGGEDIEITLTHQEVIDLEDTFQISHVLNSVWGVSKVTVNGVTKIEGVDYNVVGTNLVFTTPPAAGSAIIVTISHVPVNLSTQEIVDQINSQITNPGISATTTNDSFERIVITFVTTNPEELLVLSASPSGTNALLGFSNNGATVKPPSELQVVSTDMSVFEIATQINNASGLPAITASVNNSNQIVIQSTNSLLAMTGSAVAILGLDTSYTANVVEVETYSTMLQAINEINQTLANNNITDVTVTTSGNRIVISTENNILDLGDTDFNTIAGLPTGELVSINEDAKNNFIEYINGEGHWLNISHLDPALFNIWTADDSTYEVENLDGVSTKFFGWNMFQVQNQSMLYSESNQNVVGLDGNPGTCGICAGTATRDGNDAEVTTNISHNLNVGDYVLLLNTTTVPNIDGIHKITRLGTGIYADRVFYIDRYIEECGDAVSILPLRTQRFNTLEERDLSLSSPSWNPPPGNLGYSNYDEDASRSTNVYSLVYDVVSGQEYTDGKIRSIVTDNPDAFVWSLKRKTTHRPTNLDIKNAVIYDTNSNMVINEFEVFDPLQGIIPGVADRELDFKSVFDPATYSETTDEEYSTDDEDCWAAHQVGQRWWDTSKARYYDYNQGTLLARATWWGKGFHDSEIVVWEWTKSTVAPDDYAEAVDSEIEMFGVVATGQAYSKFDPISNEMLYYYTQQEEWDASLGKYKNVYYFWVRDKETISDKKHTMPATSVAAIIADPSAQGISWIAAISNDAVIISNVDYLLTDNSTVLQINKKVSGHAHNNWMLLAREVDIVPEYWYVGLRNNLAGQDSYGVNIPNEDLHKLNRYGDDRKLGQAWFDNLVAARIEAVSVINDLLKGINLIEEFNTTWNKELSREVAPGKVFPKTFWKWSDFISDDFNDYQSESYEIADMSELDSLDNTKHSMVKLEIIDTEYDLDRSEYFAYINGDWQLVKKNNATIEFDHYQLSLKYTWDTLPWDSHPWDNTFIADYWKVLINACRNDWFINEYEYKFNKLFFAMVDYTLSRFKQPNWIHKSTYIKVNIDGALETGVRRYKRDHVNEVLGYINTVKPFHTKISNINQSYKGKEEVSLHIEDSVKAAITMFAKNTVDNYFEGTIIDGTTVINSLTIQPSGSNIVEIVGVQLDEDNWMVETVSMGGELLQETFDYKLEGNTLTFETAPETEIVVTFVVAQETIMSGGDFGDDTQFENVMDGGELYSPYNYPLAYPDERLPWQSTLVPLRPIELLNVLVQTNRTGSTVDSETRTFVYIQDNNANKSSFGLAEASSTTLSLDIGRNDQFVSLTDGTSFAQTGFAYINGEIVSYNRNANDLQLTRRAMNGTFAKAHVQGSLVVDVTSAVLSTLNGVGYKFNQSGSSILDSSPEGLEPSELALVGQGIEI